MFFRGQSTFLQQDRRGVTGDVVLQVGASSQPVGQVHRALLSAAEVALSSAVEPESRKDRRVFNKRADVDVHGWCFCGGHSLHDEDVDSVHEDQDQRLPPEHKHT